MGQKTHPLGFRIGIKERWRSRWNSTKKDFPKTIKEDQIIRKYLKKAYFFAGIPMIEIERTGENTTIIVHTARPGILIGKKGKKLEEIQQELEGIIKDKTRKLRLTISEVNRPELNGQLEFRSRRTHHGDIQQVWDPDDFADGNDRDLDQDSFRGGLRPALLATCPFVLVMNMASLLRSA